ncbi:DUF1642 domain-containing protein [Streptococcus pyogenes]|uniref:DUF1642 domain-containing protein n=1 Tax=Streptococcus pyogenes TaxID=1314 RepID=UPI003D02ADD1
MNKEEAKQKLHNLAFAKLDTKPDDLKLADVMQIVNQIDEPQAGRAEEAPRSIWREGYEQGKFEGAWVGEQLKDADEIRRELNKPVIPQFVADWIELCKKSTRSLRGAMHYAKGTDVERWLIPSDNQETFARAWLDGYEVEEDKRYAVKLKNTNDYLNQTEVGFHFYDNGRNNEKFTRKEIEDAGFGEVFNCPLFEVEEVDHDRN